MNKGFTLLELVVVMAIVLLLTVLIFPAFRLGEKNFSLENATAKLSRDLRRAEDMALSAKQFQGIVPRGGYGIYVNAATNSYILFADCDDSTPNPSNPTPDHLYNPGSNNCGGFPEIVETINLGNYLLVSSLAPSSPLHIVFTAPRPLVTLSGAGNEAIITFALKDNLNRNLKVKINKLGLIEITN